MSLTPKEEREQYANIEVIKNNCVVCRKTQEDHEGRIRFLEKYYWIFFGGASLALFFVNYFMNKGI